MLPPPTELEVQVFSAGAEAVRQALEVTTGAMQLAGAQVLQRVRCVLYLLLSRPIAAVKLSSNNPVQVPHPLCADGLLTRLAARAVMGLRPASRSSTAGRRVVGQNEAVDQIIATVRAIPLESAAGLRLCRTRPSSDHMHINAMTLLSSWLHSGQIGSLHRVQLRSPMKSWCSAALALHASYLVMTRAAESFQQRLRARKRSQMVAVQPRPPAMVLRWIGTAAWLSHHHVRLVICH